MRSILPTLLLLSWYSLSLSAEETGHARFISEYAKVFNDGNTQDLVDHFYAAPLSLIQNDRTVVMKNADEIFERIESMVVALGVRDGAVTKVLNVSSCVISGNLALVKGDFQRDFASGGSIEMTYIYLLSATGTNI